MTHEAASRSLPNAGATSIESMFRLLALLNERARVVEIIGTVKRDQAMPVYEPNREDQVFRNVLEHNHGPLHGDAVRRIFERVIDEMRTLQKTRMQS